MFVFDTIVYLLAAFGLWQLLSIPFMLRKTSLDGWELNHVEDVEPEDSMKWAPRGAEPLKLIHLRKGKQVRTVVRKAMVRDVGQGPVIAVETYWEGSGQKLLASELNTLDEMVDTYRDLQERREEAQRLTRKSVNQLTVPQKLV